MSNGSARLNELEEDILKPLEITNKLLSQGEGCHLDFYTINFTRLACRDFRVSSQGQRLYNHCLINLPIHGSGDERLQFGWGEQHILRNMGVQLYEYEHLLLASALGEYFSEYYAAAVYSYLAGWIEDKDRPKPGFYSFKDLVHGANGVLATSDFPLVVDERIRLNPYRNLNDGLPFSEQPQETLSVAKLAEALCYIADVKDEDSRSELRLAGGDVLGWFSAFADICLGLDVTLLNHEGKELHRANANGTKRVILTFVPLSVSQSDGAGEVIWLREPAMCAPVLDFKYHATIHSGRLTAQAILNLTFGPAFHRLEQTEAKAFANALGGLARMWEIFAGDEGVSTEVISAENRSNVGSWGIGLIETWGNWFPELRRLQGRMERALKLDREAAAKLCEDSILHLEPLCGCYLCSPGAGPEERPSNLPKEGFCLPTLMETIVMLGLALSRVALTPALFPSRAGLLNMYKSQMRKRRDLKRTNAKGFDRHVLLFGEDWNSTFRNRLLNVIALFSGSWPKSDLPANLMGIGHQGVCAYSMQLERGDQRAPHPDDQVIRVITGSINWRQRTLRRVCLGILPATDGADLSWEELQCDHLKEKLYVK